MALNRMQPPICRTLGPERESRETHGVHSLQRLEALRRRSGGPQLVCEQDKVTAVWYLRVLGGSFRS